jgi:hypothetical protein
LLLGIRNAQHLVGGRIILMEREPYLDYMVRRLREERIGKNMIAIETDMAELTKTYYNSLKRLKEVLNINSELEKKISILGGDPKQLELKL